MNGRGSPAAMEFSETPTNLLDPLLDICPLRAGFSPVAKCAAMLREESQSAPGERRLPRSPVDKSHFGVIPRFRLPGRADLHTLITEEANLQVRPATVSDRAVGRPDAVHVAGDAV